MLNLKQISAWKLRKLSRKLHKKAEEIITLAKYDRIHVLTD
jgi:hypothetical protein